MKKLSYPLCGLIFLVSYLSTSSLNAQAFPKPMRYNVGICVGLNGTTAVCGVPDFNGPCPMPQSCNSQNN